MYSYPEYHESDDIISFLREHYHSNEDINFYEYYPPQEKAIDYLEKRKPETTNKLKKDLNFQIKTENKVTGITENISHKGKKIIFKISKGKKRGKQIPFDSKRKEHSWDSSDLLKNKLQRNYITYLINLANDVTNNHLLNKKYVLFRSILSEKTKTFEYLLNKDKNVLAESKINDIIENLYLKNNIIIEIGLKED